MLVLTKVVQTEDSWDIAKAANYQNDVAEIDLDIARNLRPQLVKRAAAFASGVQVDDGEETAFHILDEIYGLKLAYDETRLLYIGLFSRTPNNVFATNYTELRTDLIDKFYQEDPYSEETFGILFALQEASQKGLKQAKETFKDQSYAPMIERFYDDNLSYRCFVSILALCSAVNINVADQEIDVTKEYDRMKDFLSKAKSTLEGDKDGYLKHYKLAVKYWIQQIIGTAENDAEIRQNMSLKSRKLPFTAAFRSLRVEADFQI